MTTTRDRAVREAEALLFAAYRNDPAVIALKTSGRTALRPCACRGVVEADPANPWAGVTVHNETAEHQAWRARR